MSIKITRIAFEKNMFKGAEGTGSETWHWCTLAVKNFIKLGDDVTIDATEKQKVDNNGTQIEVDVVTRITKVGGQAAQQPPVVQPGTQTSSSSDVKTETAPPKDVSPTGKYRDPVTPGEADIMRKNSIMASACQGIQCRAGMIDDITRLGDEVIALYNRLLAEVKKG